MFYINNNWKNSSLSKWTYYFLVPPQIHPFSFDEAVNAGDYVTVTCAATKGDFPIDITWKLNGLRVNLFEGITTTVVNKRSNQLTIESAQAHHSGEYVCTAKNVAGVVTFSNSLNVNGIFITICLCVDFYIVFYLTIFLLQKNPPYNCFSSTAGSASWFWWWNDQCRRSCVLEVFSA